MTHRCTRCAESFPDDGFYWCMMRGVRKRVGRCKSCEKDRVNGRNLLLRKAAEAERSEQAARLASLLGSRPAREDAPTPTTHRCARCDGIFPDGGFYWCVVRYKRRRQSRCKSCESARVVASRSPEQGRAAMQRFKDKLGGAEAYNDYQRRWRAAQISPALADEMPVHDLT